MQHGISAASRWRRGMTVSRRPSFASIWGLHSYPSCGTPEVSILTFKRKPAFDVLLIRCHFRADIESWIATFASTSSQLDEKVADPHYRHGPGQPLSSSLARRVRVQLLPLSPLLFVCGVRAHRLLDLIKGPWPLLWGRGEMAERGLVRFGLCLRSVVLSVCSLCLIISFPSASFKN